MVLGPDGGDQDAPPPATEANNNKKEASYDHPPLEDWHNDADKKDYLKAQVDTEGETGPLLLPPMPGTTMWTTNTALRKTMPRLIQSYMSITLPQNPDQPEALCAISYQDLAAPLCPQTREEVRRQHQLGFIRFTTGPHAPGIQCIGQSD